MDTTTVAPIAAKRASVAPLLIAFAVFAITIAGIAIGAGGLSQMIGVDLSGNLPNPHLAAYEANPPAIVEVRKPAPAPDETASSTDGQKIFPAVPDGGTSAGIAQRSSSDTNKLADIIRQQSKLISDQIAALQTLQFKADTQLASIGQLQANVQERSFTVTRLEQDNQKSAQQISELQQANKQLASLESSGWISCTVDANGIKTCRPIYPASVVANFAPPAVVCYIQPQPQCQCSINSH